MQINSICIKKYRRNFPTLWIFLDENRILDDLNFLKLFPSAKFIGVVVRTKNKKKTIQKIKINIKNMQG